MVKGSFPCWHPHTSSKTNIWPTKTPLWVGIYLMAKCLTDSLPSGCESKLASRNTRERGIEKDGEKEWHSWHCGRWFRETNTCLAAVNVIITMRWWGNPAIFLLLFVCVYVRVLLIIHQCVLCQCRQWVGIFAMFMCGYCVWTEWSLYSRHVVYSVLSDSLLLASVVYLCCLWGVWLTPHNWPTRNWPDLTTPPEINQRQHHGTKTVENNHPCYK